MTVGFRTSVDYSPPSPLGLLPGRMVVEHTCRRCLAVVSTDDLIDHAKIHEAAGRPPAEGG